MSWIARIVIALVFAVVAWLVCLLLAAVLPLLVFPLAVTLGHFIGQWAFVVAVLVFLWYLFLGYALYPVRRP